MTTYLIRLFTAHVLCILLTTCVLIHQTYAQNWISAAAAGFSSLSPDVGSNVDPTDNLEDEEEGSRRLFLDDCHSRYFTAEQKEICRNNPLSMIPVKYGARDAIVECHYQFKFERWNCTTLPSDNDTQQDIFGSTLRSANKETAFISAITSAGVVHAVTRACSSGNLTECNCDSRHSSREYNKDHLKKSGKKWSWGGCSDDVDYGIRFSKRFLDRTERTQHQKTPNVLHLMNIHNNDVGRTTIKEMMRKQCRCHGVSGSCEFKTCWWQMPKFSDVGREVKDRYDKFSVQVTKRVKRRLRRKAKSERKIKIRSNDLVYVNRSPNYCEYNPQLGILGTVGRQCNRSSLLGDSCDLLCCGRGYNTRSEIRQNKCSCKFVYCCYVKCKTCTKVVDVTTCK